MEIPSVPPLVFRDLGFEGGGGTVEVISPDHLNSLEPSMKMDFSDIIVFGGLFPQKKHYFGVFGAKRRIFFGVLGDFFWGF